MEIDVFQVDAFTDQLFKGNPAAVCPLNEWVSDTLMQSIAFENNLSETVFYVKNDNGYDIRWFTPRKEVKLCGHATLAAAFVISFLSKEKIDAIRFDSLSGPLHVLLDKDEYTLDFPLADLTNVAIPEWANDCLSVMPISASRANEDFLLEFISQTQIEKLEVDLKELAKVPMRGLIVTAPGDSVDFVSRFFAPTAGINEDPVTGSAHTALAPYWFGKLGKSKMTAVQVSERTGTLICEVKGDRVFMTGKGRLFLRGKILLD